MIARSNAIRYSFGDKVFLGFGWVVLSIILIVVLYPLLFVVSASFSAGPSIMSLSLIPPRPTIAGYQIVLQYRDIWVGYANSLFYMGVGTFINLLLTVLCAYPLSRPDFKGRSFIMVLCLITMYFSGGMIPNFLLVRNLGLLNTRWALLLPGGMSIFNMIIMRTYFSTQVPGEILESAQMDGCGNIRFMLRILLPLSTPILAVLGLFYAVTHWNAYFDAMIYLRNRSLFPLSLILREILVINTANIDQMEISQLMLLEERRNVMRYSVIVISTLPVMLLYPFVQKYFVKGMMIGSVKG